MHNGLLDTPRRLVGSGKDLRRRVSYQLCAMGAIISVPVYQVRYPRYITRRQGASRSVLDVRRQSSFTCVIGTEEIEGYF